MDSILIGVAAFGFVSFAIATGLAVVIVLLVMRGSGKANEVAEQQEAAGQGRLF